MAEYLNLQTRQLLMSCLACIAISMPFGSAWSQALPDPTRPPAPMVDGQYNGKAANADSALQSIIVSPVRRQAIINGHTVTVGDSVGDAKVIRINENEVVLRKGKELHTLKLYPNVEERLNTSRTDVNNGSRRQ